MNADDVYAQFVQQPHGHGYKHKGENIGCWGDDGCYDKQGNNDVSTKTPHNSGIDNPKPAHNPTYYRDLEYNAHTETDGHESVDIRFYGDGVLNYLTDLIHAKKTECKWKDQKIAEQKSKDEQNE